MYLQLSPAFTQRYLQAGAVAVLDPHLDVQRAVCARTFSCLAKASPRAGLSSKVSSDSRLRLLLPSTPTPTRSTARLWGGFLAFCLASAKGRNSAKKYIVLPQPLHGQAVGMPSCQSAACVPNPRPPFVQTPTNTELRPQLSWEHLEEGEAPVDGAGYPKESPGFPSPLLGPGSRSVCLARGQAGMWFGWTASCRCAPIPPHTPSSQCKERERGGRAGEGKTALVGD